MKVFFLSFILLSFAYTTQVALAQSADQPANYQGSSPIFQIFIGNSSQAVKWYMEPNSISNEFGESILQVEGDAKASLLAKIQRLQNDPRISKFELNSQENQLRIDMPNMNQDAILRELERLILQ